MRFGFAILFCAFTACGAPEFGDIESVAYLRDGNRSLTFEEVRELEFTKSETPSPTFGYTDDVIWLRVKLRDGLEIGDDYYLNIAYPHLDDIRLFQWDLSRWQVKSTGDQLSFATREIDNANFYLRLIAPSNKPIYVRVESSGPKIVPLSLQSGSEIPGQAMRRSMILGAVFGLLAIIALYNLTLYISVRDPNFLYYALYVSLLTGAFFCFERFDYQFIWREPSTISNRSFAILGTAAYFWATRFARRYLDTQNNSPLFHHVLGGLSYVHLAGIVLFLFYENYGLLARTVNAFILITLLVIITVSVLLTVRGSRSARFFIVAWPIFIAGSILGLFRFEGSVPDTFFTQYGVYIGAIIEVVLISFGLGDRINQMRLQTERAQRESLELQQTLTQSYARFVPEQLLTRLGKSTILDVRLGDAVEREMTILFSDIRSFTVISETMTPRENFEFINSFLQNTGPVIREQGGYIDKYIGDSIMALFPESPEHALLSAVQMRRLLSAYNVRRKHNGFREIQIGIGINTGPVMLGIVGEEQRLEGTVIADAVNLAARLEGLCKRYGATILISEQTLFRLPEPENYHYRILDYVRVKGKSDTVTVVEVFDGDPPELFGQKNQSRVSFERAVTLFGTGDFTSARARFEDVLRNSPDDPAAAIYAARAAEYERHGPPPNWQGITDLDQK